MTCNCFSTVQQTIHLSVAHVLFIFVYFVNIFDLWKDKVNNFYLIDMTIHFM